MFLLIVIGLLMGAGLSVGILLIAIVYLRRWARMTRRKAQTAALIRERMRAVELVTHMSNTTDQSGLRSSKSAARCG